ncbi:MAG: transposase, partial [Betaproteobacteria bacterium]|nr:transposase [Betaproteobacteria bacterium]
MLQERLFTVKTLNDFVPVEHPLRAIREIVNVALKEMDTLFARMYSEFGRESIAPERLLRALILQALYSIRSERQICEQLSYNMLFRWFTGIGMDD